MMHNCEMRRKIEWLSKLFRHKNLKVHMYSPFYCENRVENVWKDLKTGVHKWSPSNMTDELLCKGQCLKKSLSKCTKVRQTP